jgi:hypothetical protein
MKQLTSKLLITFSLVVSIPLTQACTTFATFVPATQSLLIAKNRDNHPDRQIIEVVAQAGKFKYLALSREDVPDFVSAGINEKNLAVFNEVTVEYSSQARGGIADDFSKDILQNYAKVTDVIPALPQLVAKFPDPVFYQVADKEHLLAIEVAPKQKFKYKLYTRGSFAHTNNYQESSLITNYPYTATERSRWLNSQTRYLRALQLISQTPAPTLASMQKIALDHHAGYSNSILRTGEATDPASVRSLAFFAVQIAQEPKQASQVMANLYTMGEKYQLNLAPSFWQQFGVGYTTLKPNR